MVYRKRGGSHYQTSGLPELPELPRAVCRGMSMDMFVARDGEHNEVRFNPRPAQRICQRCPERADCLAYAVSDPTLKGVWGGATENDRALMRTERAVA